ncbi:MAG TPA: SPOR domain-containing protein, partial [Bradyrhizobium sp.]|nr:SPOR domain-containing protein [Bradyrhizobium sp.]
MAELARLIGQTDPFGSMGRPSQRISPAANAREQYQQSPPPELDDGLPAGPLPWMQRATRQEVPRQDYPDEYRSAVHPILRHATPQAAAEPDYRAAASFAEDDRDSGPSRYDDVLYGRIEHDAPESERDDVYADDPYYREGHDFEEHAPQRRRGGMVTVLAILALAVAGTAAAFAYRTYVGSSRSGEPPIIRADAGPTKIVPTPSDGITKVPDRLTAGEGTERLLSREEAPVDLNAKSAPRVIFPPVNPAGNPMPAASTAPSALPA